MDQPCNPGTQQQIGAPINVPIDNAQNMHFLMLGPPISAQSVSVHGARVEYWPPYIDPFLVPGTFWPLEAPVRVYDSRQSQGRLSGGLAREISVAMSPNGVTLVPEWASGIAYTLTLDQTEGSGFLSLYPYDHAFPGTSSVNWFQSGQIVANGGNVALPADGSRHLLVEAGGAGSTHFILDITGVYR